MSETLVTVTDVSKKFCRDLRTSLWYGVKDIGNELLGRSKAAHAGLRPKEFWAVSDVNFEVKRGECLGLIGHNGAGKSTLLKMLNGLIKPDKGRIEMKGRVGALIELGAGFNPILTGRENIYVNGAVLGFSKAEITRKLETIIDFAEIGEFIDTPVQYYSSGMKVRLGFAVAAQMEPDVLIIDEVLAVGDVGFRVKCLNKITELAKNASVIFVSHQMPQISRISDIVLLLNKGQVEYLSNNVGQGIQLYYDKFKKAAEKKFASDKLDIVQFVTLGTDDPFKYDDDIPVKISILSNDYNGDANLILTILDQSGRAVASIVSEKFPMTSGEAKSIDLVYKNYFSQGVFTINLTVISLRDNKREILMKYNNVSTFRSAGDFITVGEIPVGLKGVWNFN